jgi:hypothetical protein
MIWLLKVAGAWLLLAAVFALGLGQFNIPTLLRLAKHGERTTAAIVQPDCSNHSRASYRFVVGTAYYSGSDVMQMADCQSLHPGDGIPVYFDLTDPTVSRAIEPRVGLMNELISIAFACLVFPSMVIFALGRYRKSRDRHA